MWKKTQKVHYNEILHGMDEFLSPLPLPTIEPETIEIEEEDPNFNFFRTHSINEKKIEFFFFLQLNQKIWKVKKIVFFTKKIGFFWKKKLRASNKDAPPPV